MGSSHSMHFLNTGKNLIFFRYSWAFSLRWQLLSVCCPIKKLFRTWNARLYFKGAQLVGTIGPRRCSFVWPLLGALSGAPFCLSFWNMTPSFNPSILLSCLFFQWKVEWNPDYFRNLAELKLNRQHQPENSSEIFKSPQWASYVYYCIGAIVFAMIFSASVYQNLQVDMNGQRVKIQDVLTDFVKAQEFSQFFRQISDILQEIWQFYKQYGFQGLWKQIWMILDSESEKQAYFVREK